MYIVLMKLGTSNWLTVNSNEEPLVLNSEEGCAEAIKNIIQKNNLLKGNYQYRVLTFDEIANNNVENML